MTDDRQRVLNCLGRFPRGASRRQLREALAIGPERLRSVLAELQASGDVVTVDVAGNGPRRVLRGFRLTAAGRAAVKPTRSELAKAVARLEPDPPNLGDVDRLARRAADR